MKNILLVALLSLVSHGSISPKPPKPPKTVKTVKTAKTYLGVKYRFGGQTRKGLDCSSFTQKVMKSNKIKIPRTASKQARVGKHIPKKKLKPGDLVFFKGTYKKGISHVGIYLGKGKFIHASSAAREVTISNLNKPYYLKHYAGARRV